MRMEKYDKYSSGSSSAIATTAVSSTTTSSGGVVAGGVGSTSPGGNNSSMATTLTAKPHAFAGAVLSPKLARDLTPSLCLAIASALAEQAYRKTAVPYTLWITEAWRVLGWAEPSAALFWEMATMYHTLYLAGRAHASEFHNRNNNNGSNETNSNTGAATPNAGAAATTIPPILSCGSTSSVGSGTTHPTDRPMSLVDKKKISTSASAKELPVWLVGTFLLFHCEEMAYFRNLSGQHSPDEQLRRFQSSTTTATTTPTSTSSTTGAATKVDFTNLLKHPSPRTRLHAEWNNDNSHYTAYLLRQLRKVLLLSAVSHNPDAVRACMHLAAIPSPSPISPSAASSSSSALNQRNAAKATGGWSRSSTDEIRRQHDDEHGNVGLSVRLTMEDLERLHFWLQPPSGGGIDDAPLKIGDFLWSSLYGPPVPPTASIPIGDVEREVRRHLELELLISGADGDNKDENNSKPTAPGTNNDVVDDETAATSAALANLTLENSTSDHLHHHDHTGERAKQPQQGYEKELTYMNLRGTTILLKPNAHEQPPPSSGASTASGEPPHFVGSLANAGRLHDLVISACSDAHMYLLQPFEQVTIAGCTGCTIVVGSVAGLLHVVDCDKTTITAAARRILISTSCDVQMYVFTPSPPLLVGDNRSCQFAPYNTYYDGLREDLLATGLAAAVVPENQSPYHGGAAREQQQSQQQQQQQQPQQQQQHDAAWPPLQCASNKWKQPIELSKLEIPQVPNAATTPISAAGGATASAPSGTVSAASGTTPTGTTGGSSPNSNASSPGADDRAISGGTGNDATMHAPVLLPASEFHILFVPVESESSRQRREEDHHYHHHQQQQQSDDERAGSGTGGAATSSSTITVGGESQYCRWLAEVLQLSPFRLPVEYERRSLVMADRMRSIQQAVQKDLTEEQRRRFEEELNRGFRDWLVTSGNLRQVLDLVHLERRGAI